MFSAGNLKKQRNFGIHTISYLLFTLAHHFTLGLVRSIFKFQIVFIFSAQEMEERCGIKPMLYVIAANADGTLRDVTKRYAGERYDTQTRKARSSTESWFQETICEYLFFKVRYRSSQ